MPAIKRIVGIENFRYSSRQFAIFRIIFGIYLTWHFALLIPFAGELFSSSGVIPHPELLPTTKIFPNILSYFPSQNFACGFVVGLCLLSFLFCLGVARPIVCVFLWLGWATLFNRNIFIGNPGLPMVGWLLLACALVPPGEDWALSAKRADWKMPPILFWGAWLIVGVGYTVSGIHKLSSPSWVDGSAIRILLDNPLARDTPLRELLLTAPAWFFKFKTYFSLGIEILFLPLILTRWTRPIAWFAIVAMHLGILSLVSFADLTLGVLIMHFFTFDSRWLDTLGEKIREYQVASRKTA